VAALRPPEEQPGLERPAPGVVEMPDLPPPLDPQQIRPRPQLPVRGTAEGRFVSQSNARNALAAITPGPGRAYSPAPPVSNLRRTLDTFLGSPTAAGTPQAETEALLEAAARRSVAPGEVAPTGAQYARQIGAREGVLERGARDVASGAVSTASGLLGFLASETGSRALRSGQVKVDELARDLLPADPGFLDQLASGFGSTATFFIPGLGIARGAQAAALLAPRMALWLGSGAAAGMEAAVEAGSVYGQLLDQGRSEREAAQAAERVFWKNAALVGLTNRLGLFAEKGGQLARRSLAAAMEYGQEAGQQGISNVETGRPVGEGTGTSGTIGAIVGAALGGGPVVRRPRPERLGEALADKIESTQFARPAEAVAAERLDPSRAQLQGRRRETVQTVQHQTPESAVRFDERAEPTPIAAAEIPAVQRSEPQGGTSPVEATQEPAPSGAPEQRERAQETPEPKVTEQEPPPQRAAASRSGGAAMKLLGDDAESERQGRAAMERVISERTDVPAAMSREGLGEISFYWGQPGDPQRNFKGGWGVAKIIAKRNAEHGDGEAVARAMPDVIARGRVGEPYGPPGGERVNITAGDHTAVLSRYRHRNKETWLLTGWRREGTPDGAEEVNSSRPYARRPSGMQNDEGAGARGESVAPTKSNGEEPAGTSGERGRRATVPESIQPAAGSEQSLPPPPKGGKTGPVSMAASAVNADAGGNYAGLVEQREEPPVGPAPPRAERGEPNRREDVLLPFLRALKVPVYEGRVRGARRLGFYLPKSEAVRIKRKSDLEVVAHEIAHLIDDRAFGGFARGKKGARPWVKGKGARELAAELREVSYDASKVYEGFAEFVRLWMTQPDEAAARAPKFHAWWERWVNLPASENPYGEALRDAAMRMRSWYAQHPIQRMASSGFRRMLLEDGRLVSGPSGEGSSGVARSGTPRWWAAPYFWPVRSERGALETSGENPLWKFGYMFVYWFLV